MATVPKPEYRILISKTDKTADFTPFLLSITWIDKLTGETDTLNITLEDHDGRWSGDWYPTKGTEIEAYIGYEGQLLFCGKFNVESINMSGPPDTVEITAHGTSNKIPIRTKNHTSYHDHSLSDIAGKIAAKHKLSVVGDVPTEKLKYSCQKDETDLGYLQRLASENNAVFTVKGDKLIFHDIAALDAQKTAWIIKKSDVASYTWNDKFTETGVSLSYFDGDNEETIDFNVDTGDDDGVPPGDLVKFRNVVAAWTQQNTRGKAEQKKAKSAENGMTLTLEGNIKLVAGCNIELQGFGAALGKKIMRISEATHKIDGGGYTTDLTLKSI